MNNSLCLRLSSMADSVAIADVMAIADMFPLFSHTKTQSRPLSMGIEPRVVTDCHNDGNHK